MCAIFAMATDHIITSKYKYKGSVYQNLAHKYGEFNFVNSDSYKGECKYGKIDGFGTYTYADGSCYTGFFSYGKSCGIGTLSNMNFIYKGTWRLDKKHGHFYKTDKINYKTYKQIWVRDILVSCHETQYIAPDRLETTKNKFKNFTHTPNNMIDKPKTLRQTLCIGCSTVPANMASVECGHLALCKDCITLCTVCPMCRVPLKQVIKIFIC